MAYPPSQTSSPPQVTRRLSDQRETSKARGTTDPQAAQRLTRELGYRALSKDKARATAAAAEVQTARTPLRPSPITPRQISFQDEALQSISAYSRRRSSITDTNQTLRGSQHRATSLAYAQGRGYSSSPLVPKVVDAHRQEGAGVEGTESSASTAAPSTVWDELDDLKSRIHRLELTGKIPRFVRSSHVRGVGRPTPNRDDQCHNNVSVAEAYLEEQRCSAGCRQHNFVAARVAAHMCYRHYRRQRVSSARTCTAPWNLLRPMR